jgi:hypothetical protein
MKKLKIKVPRNNKHVEKSPKTYPESIPVPPMTKAQWAAARAGGERLVSSPFALVEARYEESQDSLFFRLRNGSTISIPRKQIREVAKAPSAALREIEIQPGLDAFSIEVIDVDIYFPGLIADEFAELFARGMGKKALGKTSKKKARSSALNGKRGGRPRTKAKERTAVSAGSQKTSRTAA